MVLLTERAVGVTCTIVRYARRERSGARRVYNRRALGQVHAHLYNPRLEHANISRRAKQGMERARAEGKLAGRRWSISLARMRTIQRMRKDLGMSLAQIAQGQGVSESLVRRFLNIEDVEALPATGSMGSRIMGGGAERVYSAAGTWVEQVLRTDGSLFTPGKSIWSSRWLGELHQRFLNHPDESSASFEDKLQAQLKGSQPEAYQRVPPPTRG